MGKKSPFCTHDELVQLRQESLVLVLDFIMMHPDGELKDEYESFCEAYEMEKNELSAREFLSMMGDALEMGMECGDA